MFSRFKQQFLAGTIVILLILGGSLAFRTPGTWDTIRKYFGNSPTIGTPKITFQTVEKSADASVLTAAEASDSLVTNRGWDGNDDQTITLPEADTSVGAGLKFKFLAAIASGSTADTYFDTEGSTTNIYLNGTAIGNGERIWTEEIAVGESIVCHTATIDGTTYDWFCDSVNGTWLDKGS